MENSNTKYRNIDLSKGSPCRQAAEGILRYAFHIDYAVPDITTENPELITSLKRICMNVCSQLTNGSGRPFFGSNTLNTDTILYDNTFLYEIIINDSILEVFHTIIQILIGDRYFPAYTILGLTNIYDAVNTSTENNLNKYSRDHGHPKESWEATDLNKKLTKISALPTFKMLVGSQADCKPPLHFNPVFASFYNAITSIRLDRINRVFCPDSIFKIDDLSILEQMRNSITPAIIEHKQLSDSKWNNNIVDTIFHYYLTEKITNINLFYSLLNNIKYTEKHTNYRFNNQETLSILSQFLRLPNVFSRMHLVRYAFDYVDKNTRSGLDFMNDMNYNELLPSVYKNPLIFIEPQYNMYSFERWHTQVQYMISFLSQQLIPACSWCFLLILLQIIEKENERNTSCDQKDILRKAVSLLGDYISKNADIIMHPVTLKCNDRNIGLDLFSKYESEWTLYYGNSDIDSIAFLFKRFFHQCNRTEYLITPLSETIFECNEINTLEYLRAHTTKSIYNKYLYQNSPPQEPKS